MNIFRRKLLIYPEIQLPLLRNSIIGFLILVVLQVSGLVFSMIWLTHQTQLSMDIVVDYRILKPWKTLLYISIIAPVFVNLIVAAYLHLFISNRFAGPLFRLEKELDKYIENGNSVNISFRENDNLKNLAEKINQAINKSKG